MSEDNRLKGGIEFNFNLGDVPVSPGYGWDYNGSEWQPGKETLSYGNDVVSVDSELNGWGWQTPTAPISFGETYKADGTYGNMTIGIGKVGLKLEVHKDNATTNREVHETVREPIFDDDGRVIGHEVRELSPRGWTFSEYDLDGNLLSEPEFYPLDPISYGYTSQRHSTGYSPYTQFRADPGSDNRQSLSAEDIKQWATSIGLAPGLVDQIPEDLSAALGFIGDLSTALETGSTHRDDGAVDFWSDGTTVGRTNPKSNYNDGFIDHYGTVDTDGYASVSIGGHVRGLGDWLGFDGTFGLDGGFSKPGEGKQPDTTPDFGLPSKPDGNSGGSDLAPISSPRPRAREDRDGGDRGGGSSSGGHDGNTGRSGGNVGGGLSGEDRPLILDLDGTGVEPTQLQNSTVFVDSSGDGLLNRTAWAAAGNGVLFYDADGDGTISEKREYVFTEWDPTATSDIEALRAVFDSNGDGVFDANDDAWADFKVLVTKADGSLEAKTLAELGITSIDLTADATNIELPDGSVITGKTTFTWSDGSTGTVADTMLVSDTTSYRIEETESTDTNGTRTHVQTGYAADGTIAFVITSVTTVDGASVTNSYDTNGDGVVDQLQTIVTVANPDGSKSETVTNRLGADLATGILLSETRTTTSADGNTVTIERDSTGGGWYDQTEIRTTHADDSMTIVTTDRDPNGGIIRSSTETVSADGLTRTDAIDEDGDGAVDLTITHTIVINGDGSRSETIEHFNQDGSLRSAVIENVSADGQTKTIARDLDGDGDTDVQEELDIVVNADGTTDSTLTVKNGDGGLRSTTDHSQSEDALTKSSAVDQDGDGDVDLTTVEATMINADGSRETETTQTNTDGSVRSKTKVTLGSDQVSSETWIDHNQDGTYQATDLSRSITVDGTTGDRTTTSWTRNADGSFSAQSVSISSEDGLIVTTDIDADGDGDTDRSVSDVTVENADGSSTRTVTETAQDGSLISGQVVTTSADGLTVTTVSDVDGDGFADGKSVVSQVSNADGSTLQTTTSYAGDQTTVLGETSISQNVNRRITITTSDANGDGAEDLIQASIKNADGSMTELMKRSSADGTSLSSQQTSISTDGLTVSTLVDMDGDGDTDINSVHATVLTADGGRTTTSTIRNGDSSLRSQGVTTVSDDGLVTTTTEDADGDGTFERNATSTTVLNADGSTTTTEDTRSSDGSLLSRRETIVSDDGLTVETRSDADGDQSADILTTRHTTLNTDGSITVTVDVKDITAANEVLRSQTVTTTSDTARDILETSDINGDGQVDTRVHRVIGDDGTVTVTETNLNSDGSLQSQMVTESSDTGLESTTTYDADGDGAYERSVDSTTVLNADGSTTQTVEEKAEDGTVYRRTVTDTSRDGWTTTTREDWDNDGDDDLTTTQVFDLSATGVETTTVTRTAADGSTLSTDTTEVSADGRTSTRSVDADGNGVEDMVTVTQLDDDGTRKTTTQYFSTGGGLEAATNTTVSGDGLTTTLSVDQNGDGEMDRIVTDATQLSANGWVKRTVDHQNGRNVSLGKEVYTTSDDGLNTTVQLDLDGDGLFDYSTESSTEFASNGDIVSRQKTLDETFGVESEIKTTTSGDGLTTRIVSDYSGDGSFDRLTTTQIGSDGSVSETVSEFAGGAQLLRTQDRTVSADGWTETLLSDLDGDGFKEREAVSIVDEDRTTTTTIREFERDSSLDSEVVQTTAANGMYRSLDVDVDGDGSTDFTRITDVSYDNQGNRITTYTETGMAGQTIYQEVEVASADGLTSSSSFDLNGDGVVDGTTQFGTELNTDGSQQSTRQTHYVDGELHSTETVSISRDGRTTIQTEDLDGNGIADRVTEVVARSDGERIVTERAFNEAGYETNTFVTTTSADGLTQTILRNGNQQTITRSSLDNGSYTWDNGVTPAIGQTHIQVSHEIDALGVETWSVSKEWKQGATTHTSFHEVRLDVAAKARVQDEAIRIYDTVLDRDVDFVELEVLAEHVHDGQLNKADLVIDLINSAEFTTRYGTLTDAEYITQIYLNTYSRAPSLGELNDSLRDLDSGSLSRAQLAQKEAESVEHILVGNGHMSTNNFDVILNPAQFERSLDKAYIANLVKSIVDVAYDRDANQYELEYLSGLLLEDIDNPDDAAAKLLELDGDIAGVASNSLHGLSGAEFVQQAFLNALGRTPTSEELQIWGENLASGRITNAQFVASLAQSIEHKSEGTTHVATSVGPVVVANGTNAEDTLTGTGNADNLYGLAGNDTLQGGDGDDTLVGGAGIDYLRGGTTAGPTYNGADTYIWRKGDGNDFIQDYGRSALEQDRLVLEDVASSDVELFRANGSFHLNIRIVSTGEVLEVSYHFQTPSLLGNGLELIEFSDGVSWSKDDIESNTTVTGTVGNDTLEGGDFGDNLYGLAGNDTLQGYDGDDVLNGGTGDDTLTGGSGADVFLFNDTSGMDTITDFQDGVDLLRLEVTGLSYSDLVITDGPGGAVVDLDGQGTITLNGVSASLLTQDDFEFV